MLEFKMPIMGADMEWGRLVEWKVKPGDRVKRGDIIAVVDTDKAALEIEVWNDGIVDRLVVPPGERVAVGTVLALLRVDGEAEKPVTVSAPPLPAAAVAPIPAMAASTSAAAVPGRPTPEPAAVDRRAAMRSIIAAAMSRSKREIPHYYLSTQMDCTRLLEWLAAENAKHAMTERMLYSAPLLKAVAKSLLKVPELNGFWKDGAFKASEAVHLGVAVSLRGGGLIAPALRDANRKDPFTVMRELQDLVNRARAGSLRSSELSDPTVTVTSLGDDGVEGIFGIIHPPQVALIGFGKIVERPWAVKDAVVVRPVLTATLSADHRASDGHRGAIFLSALNRCLQEPEKL